ELGPPVRQLGHASDEFDALIWFFAARVHGREHRRFRLKELSQPLLDETFDVAGGHPAATRGVASACLHKAAPDIVAVARTLLVGVSRRHALARIVVDQPGKQAWLSSLGAGNPVEPICRKPALDLLPECLVDDRLVLAGIALVLVDDLAAV